LVESQGKVQRTTTDPEILANLRDLSAQVTREPRHIDELCYKVFNQDVVEFMAEIPDESVDMLFTDEPFGAAKTVISFSTRKDMDTNFVWDQDVPSCMLIPWVHEAYRILKPGGALLNCGFPEWATLFKDVCLDAGFLWKATIVQIISNPRPQVRKRNFRSSHYNLWWASKDVPKTFNFGEQQEMRNWQGETICPACESSVPMIFSNKYTWPEWVNSARQIPTIWADSSPLSEPNSTHPTKKPMWLAYKYIGVFTNPGDIVVDPFCGGGTFPYMAACMGRRPIANDKLKEWKDFTESRLQHITLNFT